MKQKGLVLANHVKDADRVKTNKDKAAATRSFEAMMDMGKIDIAAVNYAGRVQ